MTVSRRDWLEGLASMAIGVSLPLKVPMPSLAEFPRKDDFNIAEGFTYLNGAYTHPMPRAAAEASQRVATRRSTLAPATGAQFSRPNGDPRAAFASLINAKPSELSLIPNTSTGENLVVEALGIPGGGDYNVVTDALHFDGALVHLYELQKRGLDLRVVSPRDGRIEMADLERVVDGKTRLIEVSLVAMYNGFQHDLKAVCDLAHAHGAHVYADIIQAVGAVPLDVRATGVDFAATASYKWLMGDFGIGFLYVREDLLDRVVRRMHWSYESAPDADIHQSPFDPQHGQVLTYTPGTTAAECFQLGTMDYTALAALGVSIPYIQSLGVENIQRHRQPMIDKLQQELPRLGFTPQTPVGSTSPIVTFAHHDAEGITKKLQKAQVEVRVAPYWMRIAPSVYNDMHDIDRLLEALH
ncbi:MAG TPA: aminotransferase class V-fold PLP-dependent enzyme [Gemmatimonadales bacterium]|jgi:selenocysteine lyase/cysteine desulfurase|nr:aminotransferase class V-fold PLP-dependent enzyme [Gemmatimonadales bacterium]